MISHLIGQIVILNLSLMNTDTYFETHFSLHLQAHLWFGFESIDGRKFLGVDLRVRTYCLWIASSARPFLPRTSDPSQRGTISSRYRLRVDTISCTSHPSRCGNYGRPSIDVVCSKYSQLFRHWARQGPRTPCSTSTPSIRTSRPTSSRSRSTPRG